MYEVHCLITTLPPPRVDETGTGNSVHCPADGIVGSQNRGHTNFPELSRASGADGRFPAVPMLIWGLRG